MKKQNWDDIQEAADFDKPKPGAYIVKIMGVEDSESKEYLKLEYDFAEGEYKGYYSDLFGSRGFWGGSFIRSYKEKALPFFKAFKTALENSNRGYIFDEDRLNDMRGKLVGVVLGEEEYTANNGSIKVRLYVAETRSVEAIRGGDFKVPEFKSLSGNATAYPSSGGGYSAAPAAGQFAELSDDDGELPF